MTAVRLPVRTRAATAAGRATAALSRRLGRGNGSVIGGRVLMAIDPDALARLATGHRAALVSGTNGKTTTTRMLAAAARTVAWVGAGQPWTADAAGCPACGGRIVFDPSWRCTACGIERPDAEVDITPDAIVLGDGSRLELGLHLPGRANRSNAAMA